ncbi:MAG: hypothetical protein ACFFDB_04575 [Promethearchaeota archaeon]
MKTGKILIIVGAILALVSTFLLSFGQTNGTDGRTLSSGIGFLFNLPEIFGNVAYWNTFNGGETTLQYVFTVVFIIFVFSGVIQLVGVANKYLALIGSLIVIAFGIMMIIFIAVDTPGWGFNRYSSLLWRAPIGIIPFDVSLIDASGVFYQTYSLGTFILIAGGALGLVGGILEFKD